MNYYIVYNNEVVGNTDNPYTPLPDPTWLVIESPLFLPTNKVYYDPVDQNIKETPEVVPYVPEPVPTPEPVRFYGTELYTQASEALDTQPALIPLFVRAAISELYQDASTLETLINTLEASINDPPQN